VRAIELACGLARPFESLHLEPYRDPVGYPTQGYGRLLSRDRSRPLTDWPTIDEETAEAWLAEDMGRAYDAAVALTLVPLEVHEAGGLSDFIFNVGSKAYKTSSLRALLNRGDKEGAFRQFQFWVYAAKKFLPGLRRRRTAEAKMFTGG